MATSQGKVTKIYDLRTLGFDQIHKELNQISKDFDSIKKAKKDAETGLASAKTSEDARKYRDQLQQIKIEEAEIRKQRQVMINEAKAEQIARQKIIQQQKEESKNAQAAAGSYAALYKQYRELYNLVKNTPKGTPVNFQGQTLQFDVAINKLQQLAAAEQDFRRQFTRDSLLVGEYTSGIVQAFKQLGLDDLIGGQITKAQDRLKNLNGVFEQLKQELSTVKVSGQGSLEGIEKALIDNRKEAQALSQQLGTLKTELRGSGDIGNQITKSIGEGFKQLKGQVASFALQFIGFQAAFNKITGEISEGLADARKIEGVEAAFRKLNDPNLLNNLRAATRGTVSDLQLMSQAVQANNFQIPLNQLGTLLDFARRRAKDTGQEVDYLVQSIITGIGRKSPLILDNLGISAVRLKEQLKGVGTESASVGDVAAAVGRIIQEESAKAGEEIDTESEKLEKNKARWENLRVELASYLLPVLSGVGTLFLGLITNLPILISILGALAVGWGVQNTQLVLLYGRMLAYNIAIGASYLAMGALTVAQAAYNAVLFVSNGALTLVTRALQFFGITLKATSGPLGVVLTLIGLLAAAYAAFGSKIQTAKDRVSDFLKLQRINRETMQAANTTIAEQTSKLDVWISVIKNASVSADTKRLALQKLIDINPAFRAALQGQTIDLQKLDAAYRSVTESIRTKALAESAAQLSAEKYKNALAITTLRQTIETEFAQGSGAVRVVKGLSEDQISQLFQGLDLGNISLRKEGGGKVDFLASDFERIRNSLLKKETEAIDVYKLYVTNQAQKEQELIKLQEEARSQAEANAKASSKQFEIDIDALKKQIEALDKQINEFQGKQKDLTALVAQRKALQAQLDKALGNNASGANDKGARLSGSEKDALREIDALRDQQLAQEKLKRSKNLIDEETYLKNILAINQKAIDDKLQLIGGGDAAEKKLIAELQLERITAEQDTNDKIFELRKKALDVQKDLQIQAAEDRAREVLDNPQATATEKAQAQLDSDRTILGLQVQFAKDIDNLEKKLGQQSVQNAKDAADAIRKTTQQLREDELNINLASLRDIKAAGEKSIAEFKSILAARRLAIAQSDASIGKKDAALTSLDKEEQKGILAREVASLQQQLPVYKNLLATKQITDKEYYDFVAQLDDKSRALLESLTGASERALSNITDIKGLLQAGIRDIFKIDVGSDADKLLAETISQTYSVAMDAMNNYFDAKADRIQQDADLEIQKLEIEKEQMLSRAQSREEELSLQKQFQAKQDAINKAAFEKEKKQKIAQAAVNLGLQLSNLAVIAFSPNPLNIATLGAAGAIMYAVQAGLAIAQYAINVGRIKRSQFAEGGNLQDIPIRGGKFGGRPHSQGGTPFEFKGRQYEAEVDELSIIRTKNAPRNQVFSITGNHTQIASALNRLGGGVNFAAGASIKKFSYGGHIGESLKAPVFVPSTSNIGPTTIQYYSDSKLDGIIEEFRNLAIEQSKRIDRMEVVQVTSSVTEAQKKQVKQSSIGTI